MISYISALTVKSLLKAAVFKSRSLFTSTLDVYKIQDSSNQILGHYFCQGKMPLTVRERYIKMIHEHPEDKNLKVSLDNFDKALLHPDQNDLKNAKDYALNILNQLK